MLLAPLVPGPCVAAVVEADWLFFIVNFVCCHSQLARDALEVHAPLAHRLGVHHLSGGLEDLAFKALYPAEYNQVSRLWYAKFCCR